MSTAAPAAELDELIAAYRTHGVEFRASELAIRLRYRELVQIHYPDKWHHGSPQQAEAASHHPVAGTPLSDIDKPSDIQLTRKRPLDVVAFRRVHPSASTKQS